MMGYDVLKTMHMLAVVLWVGGMMFMQWFLRPALGGLEVQPRVLLLHAVLRRFLNAVFLAASLVLVSGVWMVGRTARAMVQAGQSFHMPVSWSIMAAMGILMMVVFLVIRGVWFRQLSDAVHRSAWPEAGQAINRIRAAASLNLTLGIVLIVVVMMA